MKFIFAKMAKVGLKGEESVGAYHAVCAMLAIAGC
jgi:hypothetical protein